VALAPATLPSTGIWHRPERWPDATGAAAAGDGRRGRAAQDVWPAMDDRGI